MEYDLIIRNGHVVDPATGIDEIKDIGLVGNIIVDVNDSGTGKSEVDAKGCYVFPGLVDYHGHVFYGASEYAIRADSCLPFGVTSIVDPGTAGSANFDLFYQNIICASSTRIKAYLSVNPGGLFGREYHVHYDPSLLTAGQKSYGNIKAMFAKYPEALLGLKLMLSTTNVSAEGIEILEATLKLADEIGCRVCVHTTSMSITADDVAKRLRPGDIYCHCYTCTDGKSILDSAGQVSKDVLDAKNRGVLFDSANGSLHYDHEVAEKAVAQGFLPDILSSDIVCYAANVGKRVRNLPNLMSKYLMLGVDIPTLVKMVTATPAKAMGMAGKVGTLSQGAYADVAIFKLKDAKGTFEDSKETYRHTNKMFVPQMTIVNGVVVYAQVDFNNF